MRAFLALSLIFGLVACSEPKPSFISLCIFEVTPEGSYEPDLSGDILQVVPGEGGTQAGADAVNACIERRAAEDAL